MKNDSREFNQVARTNQGAEMSRLSYDGLVLQSNLGVGELLNIQDAAKSIFSDSDKKKTTSVAVTRTVHAAKNLIAMGRAIAKPSRADMQFIQSTATDNGMQLEAVMNLTVRQANERRREEMRAQTHAEIDAFLQNRTPDC